MRDAFTDTKVDDIVEAAYVKQGGRSYPTFELGLLSFLSRITAGFHVEQPTPRKRPIANSVLPFAIPNRKYRLSRFRFQLHVHGGLVVK